jgi:hypothetical protein
VKKNQWFVHGDGLPPSYVVIEPLCKINTLLTNSSTAESQDVWELVKIKADDWLQASVDAVCPGDNEVVRKLVEEWRSWL